MHNIRLPQDLIPKGRNSLYPAPLHPPPHSPAPTTGPNQGAAGEGGRVCLQVPALSPTGKLLPGCIKTIMPARSPLDVRQDLQPHELLYRSAQSFFAEPAGALV